MSGVMAGLASIINTLNLPWWVVAACVAVIAGITLAIGVGASSERDRLVAVGKTALELWLDDCPKPLEACAADWDDGWTLRQLYWERAAELGGQP